MSGGDQRLDVIGICARAETASAVDGGRGPAGVSREITEREPDRHDARHALWPVGLATSERRRLRWWARAGGR